MERRNDTKEENNDKSEGPKRGQGDFCPSSWDQNEHQERKSGEREEKQEKELREVGGKKHVKCGTENVIDGILNLLQFSGKYRILKGRKQKYSTLTWNATFLCFLWQRQTFNREQEKRGWSNSYFQGIDNDKSEISSDVEGV